MHATTASLDIAYLEWNPRGERAAVLLHGWPDSPVGWEPVAAALAGQGYRVLAPALRGFAPTRFRDASVPRSGQLAALGRDLLEFVDALGVERPVLVGHDWGARAAANACGLRDGAASHLAMLSVGYGTNDPGQPLSLQQVRNYWYHWFMATPRGEQALRDDRRAFARLMWETWSPAGLVPRPRFRGSCGRVRRTRLDRRRAAFVPASLGIRAGHAGLCGRQCAAEPGARAAGADARAARRRGYLQSPGQLGRARTVLHRAL
nr:alpha/beta fold hydrolase [Burkholderia arboris]